ncbi:hypothetical protein [Phenylobacterium aquaticum]|uniref:terminase small subunit-like protein n=1 Tax=Phenylobacterium aquaticum TaxID=1763816 RepID=UPI001F5D02E0|nr:hypothetical protein [Phenylobacterium aquaticum]MCI3131810.1 hypothetical protein [Phenylobacterium aquaticum]
MPLPDYQPARKGVTPCFETRFTAELGAEICRRVAAGMSVAAVCRLPGMPCNATVYRWRLFYPLFERDLVLARQGARRAQAAALRARKAAQAAGKKWRMTRPHPNNTYSRIQASEICRRLVLGESLQAICRDPDMPCVMTVYNWLHAHPEFAELYSHARGAQRDGLEDQVDALFARLTRWNRRREKRWFHHLRLQMGKLAPKGWDMEDRRAVGVLPCEAGEGDPAQQGGGGEVRRGG